ncbi:proteoglycan 4-like [Paramacrobiotus metropolitanus]|uniref:proteoglycan 4-like n=1 Tax=Paramacrobiotus metropolitanus TaxID=2943436 RepID=UPI0024458BB9|nr:proteoglycan 4-like [Paramacrobiotus metropolitanus]
MVDDPTNPNKYEGIYIILGIPKPNTYWIRERDTGEELTVCVDRLKPYLNPDGPSRRITRSTKKKGGDAEPEPTESEGATTKLEKLLKKQKPGKGPSKKLVEEQQKTLKIPGLKGPEPQPEEPAPKRGRGRPRKAKPDFETPALTKLQNQPLAVIDPESVPAGPDKPTAAPDKPEPKPSLPSQSLPEKPKKLKTLKKPKATLTAQQVLEEDRVADDEADKDLLTRITVGREKSEKTLTSKKQKANTLQPGVLDKTVDKAGQNDLK